MGGCRGGGALKGANLGFAISRKWGLAPAVSTALRRNTRRVPEIPPTPPSCPPTEASHVQKALKRVAMAPEGVGLWGGPLGGPPGGVEEGDRRRKRISLLRDRDPSHRDPFCCSRHAD